MTDIKMGEHQSKNGISAGYSSTSELAHQCSVCGGWFTRAHYCVGKTEYTPKPVDVNELYKKIQQLQADKDELDIIKDKLLLAIMYTDKYENLTIEGLRKKFGIKHQDSTKEG